MTPSFEKKAGKMMSEEAREELFDHLHEHPDSGDVIAGTGGVRKLRWRTGRNNKGKSGGVRVLYHYTQSILVLLITLYEKSEKEDISQAEKNAFKSEIPELVGTYLKEL